MLTPQFTPVLTTRRPGSVCASQIACELLLNADAEPSLLTSSSWELQRNDNCPRTLDSWRSEMNIGYR